MRKAPFNYLITLTAGGVIWVVTSLIVGNYLGDTVSLMGITVDGFLQWYRLLLIVAAVIGLLLCFYWYFYGAKESTAGELQHAKKIWNILFFVALVAGVGVVVALVMILRAEVFTIAEYLIFLLVMSLNTYLFFWVSTLFFSPRNVEYCVPPKR